MFRFMDAGIVTDLLQMLFIRLLKDSSMENIIPKSFSVETIARRKELIG